jgi:ribonuclease T2
MSSGKSCNGCPGNFDSYVLEQSWQPEFCHGQHYPGCSHPAPGAYMAHHLTLHGLWPQYSAARSGSTYPFNCSSTKFDPAALDKVPGGRAALIEYWPNVKSATTDWTAYQGFWTHEWGKHGTCTGLSQRDYMTAALDQLQKLGTPAVITDSIGKAPVPKAKIQAAYGGAKRVSLSCGGGQYLSQVATCWALDKASHLPAEQIDCPPSVLQEDTCHGTAVTVSGFGATPAPPGPPPPPPPPGPPLPPGPPPSGTCAANKHGPPCKRDTDCAHVPHCVRCAKSGFCTSVPMTQGDTSITGNSSSSAVA